MVHRRTFPPSSLTDQLASCPGLGSRQARLGGRSSLGWRRSVQTLQAVQHGDAAQRFLLFRRFGLGSFCLYFCSGFPLGNWRGGRFGRWVTDVVVVTGGDVQLAQVAQAAGGGVDGGEVGDLGLAV